MAVPRPRESLYLIYSNGSLGFYAKKVERKVEERVNRMDNCRKTKGDTAIHSRHGTQNETHLLT